MHRVLGIPEILEMIFSFLNEIENAINARVCKQWSEIALDALWRNITKPYLLFKFLAPLHKSISRDEYEFSRIPEFSDWSRFEKHSHRVRQLAYVAEANHLLGKSMFDDIGRTRTSLRIFPNMHTLHWNAPLLLCIIFMYANVTNFTVVIGDDASSRIFSQEVIARMPNLTYFAMNLSIPMRNIETDVVNLFSGLKKLRTVVFSQFCLTTRCMEALSVLQELTTIDLQYRKTRGNPADIQSFTPSLQEGAFPALHDLSLTVSFENASQLMTMPFGPSCRLTDVYIDSPEMESPSAIHAFFTTISSACPLIKSLSVLSRIDASPAPLHGTPPSVGACLTLESLQPLLKCAHLRCFSIVHQYPIELCQEDVEELAINWPALETIELNNEPAYLHQTTLTLQALLPFAKHCPNLETLGLFLHAASLDLPPAPADSSYVPFSRLHQLNLGLSSITDPNSVALCLSTILPLHCLVQTKYTWESSVRLAMVADVRATIIERRKKWNSVSELVPALTMLRMEDKECVHALRKEVKDLRMRMEVLTGRAVMEGAGAMRHEADTECDSYTVVRG